MFEMILSYCVCLGRGDGGDPCEWEVTLTEEEQRLFDRAILLGQDPNDIPELVEVIERERHDIESDELDKMREYAPDEVGQYTGEYPVDPDEINDLVADRDPHTLEFFGLTDMDDDELDEWDANDLDELPDHCDFDEDFEPEDPFDDWDLMIDIIIPEFELDEDSAEEAFQALFDPNDHSHRDVCEFIRYWRIDAEDSEINLREIAAAVAADLGITDFVYPEAEDDPEEA